MAQGTKSIQHASVRSREPLYKGLFQVVRRRIELGHLRPGTKAPSESDLIAEFGISSTTARRCLNDLQLAGFVERIQGKGTFVCPPHALTRGRQIGVLYNELFSLADVFLSHLLRGVGAVMEMQDVHPTLLGLGPVRQSADPSAALLELAKRHEIQGLLVVSPIPLPGLKAVLDAGIAVASINFGYDDPRIASALIDRPSQQTRIVRRLREAGHKRVVSIARRFPSELLSGVRTLRWSADGSETGLEWKNDDFVYFQPDQTREIVRKHLQGDRPPTALVTWGYELALEAKDAVRELGLRVPEDVSLMFVGVPAGPTEIAGEIVGVEEMGKWSAEILLDRLANGRWPGENVRLFPSLPHDGVTVSIVH